MVNNYTEWVRAVRSEYEKLDACYSYLSKDGKARRSQFGILASITWIYCDEDDAAMMLDYVRRNKDLQNLIHLFQALKRLEQVVEGVRF